MNHPTDDELLLLAYGELAAKRAADIESHIAACPGCAHQQAQLERGRVALDMAIPARRRRSVFARGALALAAAAVIAAVIIIQRGPPREPVERWTPTTTWSTTAGYVTGGKAMVDIDRQLTRLEQERYYGLPN